MPQFIEGTYTEMEIEEPDGSARVWECDNCGYHHNNVGDAIHCCPSWSCDNCGEYHESESGAEDCCRQAYECQSCGSTYEYEEDAWECCGVGRPQDDTYPPEIRDAVPSWEIAIPNLEHRPPRLTSLEQELSTGAASVARMLQEVGLSMEPYILNYSAEGQPGFLIVKSDSSLPPTGGEVVYSRFLLDLEDNSKSFSRAVHCIREMKKHDLVSTTTAGGTHVHISALSYHGNFRNANGHVFGPAQIAALYEIYSFCEDVIFRLGAAGWPQHRGSRYTRQMPKFAKGDVSASKAMRAVNWRDHDAHYFSLNFQRLLQAASQCRCGACMTGEWNECDCSVLNAGTIEWRVFNASTRPATLHAWLLLAHGLTAAAFGHTLGTLEPNEYQPHADVGNHPWVLAWILGNCPFTNEEREIILDVARKAPDLHVDWVDFDRHYVRMGQQVLGL